MSDPSRHSATNPSDRYLLVKHSEGWNVDRCCEWLAGQGLAHDWFYPTLGQPFPDPSRYAGVVLYGGAPSANDCQSLDWVRDELRFIEQCLAGDCPLFGICLGGQLLARVLGARVQEHPEGVKEVGFHRVDPTEQAGDFLSEPLTVMQWHSEGFELPPGTTHLAQSDVFANQAFALSERVVGVQFHPEVNPASLRIWIERNRRTKPDMLNDEQRQQFLIDAERHDAHITQWIDGFMTRWTRHSRVES